MIPRPLAECRQPGDFAKAIRASLDEADLTRLGLDDEQIANEGQLAVAVATAFPFSLAGCHVDARENSLVKPVDEAVLQHDAGELGFEVSVLPLWSDLKESFGIACDLQDSAALAVSGCDENPRRFSVAARQNDRLADIVLFVGVADPRVAPQFAAIGQCVGVKSLGVEVETTDSLRIFAS